MKEKEHEIPQKVKEIIQHLVQRNEKMAEPKITLGRNCVIFSVPKPEHIPLPPYAQKVGGSGKVTFGRNCVIFDVYPIEKIPLPPYAHKSNSTAPHQKENTR